MSESNEYIGKERFNVSYALKPICIPNSFDTLLYTAVNVLTRCSNELLRGISNALAALLHHVRVIYFSNIYKAQHLRTTGKVE
jgi:hypothetical protein